MVGFAVVLADSDYYQRQADRELKLGKEAQKKAADYQNMREDEIPVLQGFLEKDGIAFLESLYQNPYYWQSEKGREILWQISNHWNSMDTSFADMESVYYETNQAKFEEENPEWFEAEPTEEDSFQEKLTMQVENMQNLVEQARWHNQNLLVTFSVALHRFS